MVIERRSKMLKGGIEEYWVAGLLAALLEKVCSRLVGRWIVRGARD